MHLHFLLCWSFASILNVLEAVMCCVKMLSHTCSWVTLTYTERRPRVWTVIICGCSIDVYHLLCLHHHPMESVTTLMKSCAHVTKTENMDKHRYPRGRWEVFPLLHNAVLTLNHHNYRPMSELSGEQRLFVTFSPFRFWVPVLKLRPEEQ